MTFGLFVPASKAHNYCNILGCGTLGTRAIDMIGEIALTILMGINDVEIGKTGYLNLKAQAFLKKLDGLLAKVCVAMCMVCGDRVGC